jgi:16S rRNA (adenine1518-N6/adenine1519-N6)-dimethyltransferase
LKKIVSLANLTNDDFVLEIGLGSGNLTNEILSKTNRYLGYEIDLSLKNHLLSRFDKINIEFTDFMKSDIDHKLEDYSNITVIANLPYYITTPILMRLLESNLDIRQMVLMVQKEVAERFVAKPSTKEYNAVSVILQTYYQVKIELNVNRQMFIPPPRVDSAVISLRNKKNDLELTGYKTFIQNCFKQKRKQLKNNLDGEQFKRISPTLLELGYPETVRAEAIKVEDFIKLFQIANL